MSDDIGDVHAQFVEDDTTGGAGAETVDAEHLAERDEEVLHADGSIGDFDAARVGGSDHLAAELFFAGLQELLSRLGRRIEFAIDKHTSDV